MLFARLLGCLAMTVLAMAPNLDAARPLRIPAFELTALDGQTQMFDRLGINGRWLLVVIQPGCGACDSLLRLVKKREDHPNMVPRLVIVGAMSLNELKRTAARFPNLASAKWYADPARNTERQLKLAGVPVLAGIQQHTLAWTLNGLANPDRNRMTMLSWTR